MEMVQFHPTGLLGGPDTRMTGTVLEEGLRGAGGHLLNGDGERFMTRYDPAGERATRDIVSRSIHAEMIAGRTTPMGGVHIKMDHLGPQLVAKKFPGMVKRCADCGFDLAGGLVEVVPTAHYMMGGVEFEADGSTAIPGLYAAGEDCGGVHGANRLGGNGVANSTVYGAIAGDSMAAWLADASAVVPDADSERIDQGVARAEQPFGLPPGRLFQLREQLQDDMWDHAGIVRNATGLMQARTLLARHRDQLQRTGVADGERRFNLTWQDWLNLDSLLSLSDVIVEAASARNDSRGAHFRDDFPETGDLNATCFTRIEQTGGDLQTSMVPVTFSIVKPGESLIE
jgi:fumarate reductase flavoprotein subunit